MAIMKRAAASVSQALADVVLAIALVPLGAVVLILAARERCRK